MEVSVGGGCERANGGIERQGGEGGKERWQ